MQILLKKTDGLTFTTTDDGVLVEGERSEILRLKIEADRFPPVGCSADYLAG